MVFRFKSYQNILADEIAMFLSKTGVNDINAGSVISTFFEADSNEIAQEYFQMYQIIRNYNLDTTEGSDLDNRAFEFGLTRLDPQKATGYVVVSDSNITQIKTKIYSGNRGPVAAQTYIDVDDASSFPASGTIIVGRGTANAETVSYSSITNLTSFYKFNLTSGLTKDHGTDEGIILSQGGDRTISSGTVVKVPESDISEEIRYVLSESGIILDGDSNSDNIAIAAVLSGSSSNVPSGTISQFDSIPFTGATVSNTIAITNGKDRETDEELRNRIKNHIQSLSKGTRQAILSGVYGITSDTDSKRVISANIRDAITTNDIAYLFIDDGSGLEPTINGNGNEVVLEATGGEKYLQIKNFPIVKSELITQNVEPYQIIDGDNLLIEVGTENEEFIFKAADFKIQSQASAAEVASAINARSLLLEARTTGSNSKVSIRPKKIYNESLKILGGTANQSNKLNFSTKNINTIDLYRFDGINLTHLTKDGITATVEAQSVAPFALFGGETLTIVVDGKSANPQTITFLVSDFALPGSATSQEVVNRINLELSGAVAYTVDDGNTLAIKSNTENSNSSKIEITGGTANTVLNFSTDEIVGKYKDFTLNRLNGQILLEDSAVSGNIYETASLMTRAFFASKQAEFYDLNNGDTINISIDGGAPQTITFLSSDFGNISQARAEEVALVINNNLVGGFSYATDDGRVIVSTNTWDTNGTIEITSVTGNAVNLDFDIGEERVSIQSHVAYIVSTNSGPYTFVNTDKLIVIVDNNPIDNTFSITMGLNGTVTIGDATPTYNNFIANISSISQNFNTKFTINEELAGFKIKWLTGANATTISTVSSYDSSNGQFILSSGLTNAISAGDTFALIPYTSKNVEVYLSNLITSSLSSVAEIKCVQNGTKIQISSKRSGSNSSVHVTGGTANTAFSFQTAQVQGVDGYKNYSGLIQKVQNTVNGLDTNLEVFPGLAAAGTHIEVLPPIVKQISFEVNITTINGVSVLSVKDKIIGSISTYINSLGVGDDVILSEISNRVMDIYGVNDIEFISHTNNIVAADNEIIRVSENNIIVG